MRKLEFWVTWSLWIMLACWTVRCYTAELRMLRAQREILLYWETWKQAHGSRDLRDRLLREVYMTLRGTR